MSLISYSCAYKQDRRWRNHNINSAFLCALFAEMFK